MDWVAGRKDWRSFYRWKDRLGPGTKFHAAVMNDPDVAEELARQPVPRGSSNATPDPADWDRWSEAFARLEDRLAVVAASNSGGEVQLVPRPVYLVDKIRRRESQKRLRKIVSQLIPSEGNLSDG